MFSGISYDDKFEKYMRLKSEKDLEDKIKKCLGSSQRYILIPLKLTKKEWNGQSHQNILLVIKVCGINIHNVLADISGSNPDDDVT